MDSKAVEPVPMYYDDEGGHVIAFQSSPELTMAFRSRNCIDWGRRYMWHIRLRFEASAEGRRASKCAPVRKAAVAPSDS